MYKEPVQLSGVYIRVQRRRWVNICLEDLTPEERVTFLEGKSREWLVGAIEILCNNLANCGKSNYDGDDYGML